MKNKILNFGFTFTLFLGGLLVLMIVLGHRLQCPPWIHLLGRMHPMIIHFPIVLAFVGFIWEAFFVAKDDSKSVSIGNGLLLSLVLSSTLSAIFGFFLSSEEGYDVSSLNIHKWSGAIFALGTISVFGIKEHIRRSKQRIWMVGITGIIGIIIIGHEGAAITHGENFLIAPLKPPQKVEDVPLEEALVYDHMIAPILESKCTNCHNDRKQKGNLNLSTSSGLLEGGDSGPLWVNNEPERSLIIKRIHLPESSDEHMPPKGKPQLTRDEKSLIYHWIKKGGSLEQKLVDVEQNDTLRLFWQKRLSTTQEEYPDLTKISNEVLNRYNDAYQSVQPIAENSAALVVSFFGPENYTSGQLSELEPIKDNIVYINMHKIPVQDEDLKIIASFTNLKKLRLSYTEITDVGLQHLIPLKNLERLSLVGTKVNGSGLTSLSGLDKLSSIFLWDTPINEEDITRWKNENPGVKCLLGYSGDDVIAELYPPKIENKQRVFKDSMLISLKSFIKDAEIRYTIDGNEPDRESAIRYEKPFFINHTCQLKTKCFLKGWDASATSSNWFYLSKNTPDSLALITPSHQRYRSLLPSILFDGQLGGLQYADGYWIGYEGSSMMLEMYFDTPLSLSSLSIRNLVDVGSYVLPPQSIKLWGKSEYSNYQLLGNTQPIQPKESLPAYTTTYSFPIHSQGIVLLKVVVQPVQNLPPWHPGNGSPGWVFVDEIFIK